MARSPVNKSPQLARGFNQPRHIYDLAASVERELRDHATGIEQSIRPASPLLLPDAGVIPVGDGVQFVSGAGALPAIGTWTPAGAFAVSQGSFSFSSHILGSPEGYYLRIGPLAFYSFNWSVTGIANASTASGHFQITGFPFTFDPAVDWQIGVCSYEGVLSDGGAQKQCNTYVRGSQAGFRFSITGVDGFVNEVVQTHIAASGNLVFLASGFVRVVWP